MTLACLSLFLGSPQRAQADGWVSVPCYADGTPLSSDDIYYLTNGYEYLTLTDITQNDEHGNFDTFPLNSEGLYPTSPGDPNAFPFDGNPIYGSDWSEDGTIGMITNAPNDAYDYGLNSYTAANGCLTTETYGDLKGYYIWQYQDAEGNTATPPDDCPMPPTMLVAVYTNLWVWGGIDAYQTFGPNYFGGWSHNVVSGPVSASASASDSLGDHWAGSVSVSPTTSADDDTLWYFNDTVFGLPGYHLMEVPVVNGIATVDVRGYFNTTADNEAPYFQSWDDPDEFDQSYEYDYAAAYTFAQLYASAALVTPTLSGHSTVDTANWDGSHPRFFSGTNCRVDATAPAGIGSVKQVKILIGGTLTKEYDDTASLPAHPDPNVLYSSGTNQSSVSLSVHFDSTHFAHNSLIPIKMIVTNSNGDTYNVTPITAKAYNKPYVLGNEWNTPGIGSLPNGEAAVGDISGQFAAAKYGSPRTSIRDLKNAILGNLPYYSAFYIWSHGFPGGFGDCSNRGYVNANVSVSADEVVALLTNQNPNVPPYNFVFLDTCQTIGPSGAGAGRGTEAVPTRGDNLPPPIVTPFNFDLPDAFGVSIQEDTCYLGWTITVSAADPFEQFSANILQSLANGQTIQRAIISAQAKFPVDEPMKWEANNFFPVGDQNMKLHGVYGGLTADQWFK